MCVCKAFAVTGSAGKGNHLGLDDKKSILRGSRERPRMLEDTRHWP